MDQRERTGDLQAGLRAVVGGTLAEVWTALPGIVKSFDSTRMTCVVQPAIKGLQRLPNSQTQRWVQMPELLDVPVVFPSAGGFIITMPITAGDEVLVVFASRCVDAWWQNGGVGVQAELRMHDQGDGFAIPGPRSLPKVLPGFSTNSCRIQKNDSSAYIELTQAGSVNIVAPSGFNVTADTNITGSVVASEEGTFNGGHTVSAHVHPGVQSGTSDTETPTG